MKAINLPAKIMLLGVGELGKEFVIEAQRLGNYVIAVDRYENAPAMQVADCCEAKNCSGTQHYQGFVGLRCRFTQPTPGVSNLKCCVKNL